MPEAWATWECCTCHKRHSSFDDADQCERNHIVDDATAGFRSDVAKIMKRAKRDATR